MRAKRFIYISLGILALSVTLTSRSAFAQAPAYIAQWGTGGSGDGQFIHPVGVAVNAAGEVYVADQGNHRIQKFTGTGEYLMQWPLPGGDGYYDMPEGVAINSSGDVYVADSGLSRIQWFSGTGAFLDEWFFSADPAFGWKLPFLRPFGVAVDATGNVYVTNTGYGYVQKFTRGGGHLVDKWVGGSPTGVAMDASGTAYVTFGDNTIRKFTGDLAPLSSWGSSGSGNGQFAQPIGVAIGAGGEVYVVDSSNNRVQVFSGSGDYLAEWGSIGAGNGQFIQPMGVAINASGELFVVDTGNNRIQKFGPAATPTAKQSFGALKAKYR